MLLLVRRDFLKGLLNECARLVERGATTQQQLTTEIVAINFEPFHDIRPDRKFPSFFTCIIRWSISRSLFAISIKMGTVTLGVSLPIHSISNNSQLMKIGQFELIGLSEGIFALLLRMMIILRWKHSKNYQKITLQMRRMWRSHSQLKTAFKSKSTFATTFVRMNSTVSYSEMTLGRLIEFYCKFSADFSASPSDLHTIFYSSLLVCLLHSIVTYASSRSNAK